MKAICRLCIYHCLMSILNWLASDPLDDHNSEYMARQSTYSDKAYASQDYYSAIMSAAFAVPTSPSSIFRAFIFKQ
jgi:hypothetical protein